MNRKKLMGALGTNNFTLLRNFSNSQKVSVFQAFFELFYDSANFFIS